MSMRRTIGVSLALLVVSAVAVTKQAHSAQHQQAPEVKEKPAKSHTAAARTAGAQRRPDDRRPARHASRPDAASRARAERAAPADRYLGPLRIVGHEEIGSAAWYGPRHLGHRTASGAPLDDVHATAAHRSLPLNSLARLTNLRNGRSVVVKVTDRGPWSSDLLIDVSPKAADELDMKSAGIVPVKIEPVVLVKERDHLASGAD